MVNKSVMNFTCWKKASSWREAYNSYCACLGGTFFSSALIGDIEISLYYHFLQLLEFRTLILLFRQFVIGVCPFV